MLTRLNFDFHLVSRRLARVSTSGECRVTFFPNDPRCRLGVGQNLLRSLASWESVERCKGPFTYDVRQVVLLTLTQLICTERDWVVLQLKVNSSSTQLSYHQQRPVLRTAFEDSLSFHKKLTS